MAIKASGQITIVDLSDSRQLSVYLASNLPKTQILDQDTNAFSPNWQSTVLEITPTILLNQTPVALGAQGLTITYVKKEGVGAEQALGDYESVNNGVLEVNRNLLGSITSGLLTYVCKIAYTDPETEVVINTQADITYSLVKNASGAKTASISGEQVFKYPAGAVAPTTASITLTADVQGTSIKAWKYKNAEGNYVEISGAGTKTSITINATDNIFVSNVATIKLETNDDSVFDIFSITKIYDGANGEDGEDGEPGAAGADAWSVIVGNEAQTLVAEATSGHPITTATTIEIPITVYQGLTEKTYTLTWSTLPTGVTGAITDNVFRITIPAGNTMGGVDSGIITLNITPKDGSVTPIGTLEKTFSWSKSVKGAKGEDGEDGQDGQNGENAIVFTVYAPNGTVFINQSGNLTLATQAYDGSTQITSGATYEWERYSGGTWSTVGTASTLNVAGSTVANIASYKCTMTYEGKEYQDVITLEDKSDSMIATIESTGGNIFKNGIGTSVLTCKLFANGREVDELLESGNQEYTYTWYALDSDGNEATIGGASSVTGKQITVDQDDVNVKTTFICEVS